MSTIYTITAGDNSTDLGVVGRAATVLGAKRIGRAAVRNSLPNAEGTYKVWDERGRHLFSGERSVRTARAWVETQ